MRFVLLVSMILGVGVVAEGQVVTLDFEGLRADDAGMHNVGPVYESLGMKLTAGLGLSSGSIPTFISMGTLSTSFSGSTSLYHHITQGAIDLTRSDGGTFNMISIDMAELPSIDADGNPIPIDPFLMLFTGFRSDGSTVSARFTVSSFPQVQTFEFIGFAGLVSVHWLQGFGPGGTIHTPQFDNVRVELSPVGEPNCLQENGNVNGDQILDLSDAIYSLVYLFAGGPAPAPQFVADAGCVSVLKTELAECRAALEACQKAPRLPTTAQTKCYDMAGTVIDCASADFPGQDGFYQAGCHSSGRFVDNGDETVTDTCTGLMWQNQDLRYFTWQDALKYCESLSLAGYDDWRLPNVHELQSIFLYSANQGLDPIFKPRESNYWTSTTRASSPFAKWILGIDGEVLYNGGSDDHYLVRAVRGGL